MTIEITEARLDAIGSMEGTIGIEGEEGYEEIVIRVDTNEVNAIDLYYRLFDIND